MSLCGLISCVSQHKHLLVHLSCHSITKTKQGPFSLSPPRPQRGPRRRQRPSPPSVPRPTPVTSTTWRLQPPPASLVLWRKPRNPPSVAAYTLDPGVDATAAARSELRSWLPFTAVHRTVHRPQHLHGSSPSTLDARVPAIQRPSARSHRTVDNSLITGRIEYSTFLNLPLDECIVNTPPETKEVKSEKKSKRVNNSTK